MNPILDEFARIVGRAWARTWLEKLHNKETSGKPKAKSKKSGEASPIQTLTTSPKSSVQEESNDNR